MFYELSNSEVFEIYGGTNWWKVVGGVLFTVGAAAGVVVSPSPGGKFISGVGVLNGIGMIYDGFEE